MTDQNGTLSQELLGRLNAVAEGLIALEGRQVALAVRSCDGSRSLVSGAIGRLSGGGKAGRLPSHFGEEWQDARDELAMALFVSQESGRFRRSETVAAFLVLASRAFQDGSVSEAGEVSFVADTIEVVITPVEQVK